MNKQEYLLTCLQEECAEIIQASTKILRFGWESDYGGISNLMALKKEVADLNGVIDELVHIRGPDLLDYPTKWEQDKQLKLRKYMRMSSDLGLLQGELF